MSIYYGIKTTYRKVLENPDHSALVEELEEADTVFLKKNDGDRGFYDFQERTSEYCRLTDKEIISSFRRYLETYELLDTDILFGWIILGKRKEDCEMLEFTIDPTVNYRIVETKQKIFRLEDYPLIMILLD